MLVTNSDAIKEHEERRVRVTGERLEELLRDWLAEWLYLFESEHFIGKRFTVTFTPSQDSQSAEKSRSADVSKSEPRNWTVEGVALGEVVEIETTSMAHEVKAITYHGLKFEPSHAGWIAEVIVDI